MPDLRRDRGVADVSGGSGMTTTHEHVEDEVEEVKPPPIATDIVVRGVFSHQGVDFAKLHRTLALAAALYILSSLFAYTLSYILAGIVQRTMFRLRAEVEDKLNRLPLRYVDRNERGDLLSRVTND